MASELTPDDVGKMKVADLRAELKARDLSTTGLKKELADRLLEALSGSNAGDAAAPAPAAPDTGADEPQGTAPSGDATAQTSAEAAPVAAVASTEQAGTDNLPGEMPAVPPVTEDSVDDFTGGEGTVAQETATEGVETSKEPSEVVKPPADHLDKTPGFVADSREEEAGEKAEIVPLNEPAVLPGEDASLKRKHDEVAEPAVSAPEPAVASVAEQAESSAPPNDEITADPAAASILNGDGPESKRPRTDDDIPVPQDTSSISVEDISSAPIGSGDVTTNDFNNEEKKGNASATAPRSFNIRGASSTIPSSNTTEKTDKESQNRTQEETSRQEQREEPVASTSSSRPINSNSQEKPPLSRSICVSNLVRPFTLPALKSKLEDFGEMDYFWINSVKSHCFVTYQSISAAQEASSSLEGEIWPEAVGKSLSVTYIPPEKISSLVEKEEAAGRTRLELVISYDPSSNEWLYDVSAPSTASKMLGQAPPVPRGLASSLPLQARAGVLPGGGQVGQPTGLGRLDPRNMITATSASGASFQLPSSSAFAQSRPPAMRDNAFRSAGPSEAVDSGRPWTPKPGAEGLYEKTKATPPLYWKPVDKVAAGRRLRELERGPYIARNPGPSAGGRRPLPSSSFRDTYRP